MENEGRIVELLTEMLIRFDQQHTDLGDLKTEFKELRKDVNEKLGQVNNKLSSVEEQVVKLNLTSSDIHVL